MAEIVSAQVAQTLAYNNLLRVFSNRDRASRLAIIRETYTSDVTFYEPDVIATGHDGVDAKAEELLTARAGWEFVPSGNVQRNHNMIWLAWGFGPKDGSTGEVDVKVKGGDVLIVDLEQGKVKSFWVVIEGVTDSKE
ncbi:uncharacterized protein Z520_03802 [Fonsecaea multimorphosa CBS 102226]|uniref:SnoaL-like domain-containing protein n=1 Tax=Fonsecaea multimorphosa CBS 102226 TaxID=1442371 RepID=A0A0D2IT34_9EURO|nr:uncharacterized protein Z520_03802 [Fonsecaea multimorphosa CBS 102226]KIY00117.1 hypothetical protein Z520_03802 [Fonsecaea multimorphosa CBS 102226]OAL27313.1 hypothetical protein AYO22_03588 [Fonsecaea multimorphosa]